MHAHVLILLYAYINTNVYLYVNFYLYKSTHTFRNRIYMHGYKCILMMRVLKGVWPGRKYVWLEGSGQEASRIQSKKVIPAHECIQIIHAYTHIFSHIYIHTLRVHLCIHLYIHLLKYPGKKMLLRKDARKKRKSLIGYRSVICTYIRT